MYHLHEKSDRDEQLMEQLGFSKSEMASLTKHHLSLSDALNLPTIPTVYRLTLCSVLLLDCCQSPQPCLNHLQEVRDTRHSTLTQGTQRSFSNIVDQMLQ